MVKRRADADMSPVCNNFDVLGRVTAYKIYRSMQLFIDTLGEKLSGLNYAILTPHMHLYTCSGCFLTKCMSYSSCPNTIVFVEILYSGTPLKGHP